MYVCRTFESTVTTVALERDEEPCESESVAEDNEGGE